MRAFTIKREGKFTFQTYPPKEYITAKEWIEREGTKHPGTQYIKIFSGEPISRRLPGTLDKETHWKFRLADVLSQNIEIKSHAQINWDLWKKYTYQSPEAFVAVIPNGRVWGTNGTVITPDNQLLYDLSVESTLFLPQTHSVFLQSSLPKMEKIEKTAAVITTSYADSFYHWMIDALPRFELIRRSGIHPDYYIVNEWYPYHKEALDIIGIPDEKILHCNQLQHFQFPLLLAPSLPGIWGYIPRWVHDYLRSTFLLQKSLPMKKRKLYISRAKSAWRRVINEEALRELLEKQGFETFYLEELSITEQAELFANAEAIIAPHGAGLTNLVFASPGAKVIELFGPYYVQGLYWAMSWQAGLEYYYLIGEGPQPAEYEEPFKIHSEDILIDLEKVEKLLAIAGLM
ncbi:glycosyltransferase family 61 protein [Heliobacterium chlorum]|uniref:Glycosyltransferase family 61 protein n=1 Tax=Heliobacterium chlorum TaxID=2698 RepID=A0ABR7SYY1_HELCL|nr:glycosyltransferase family 61 protein [Heliobacterium chlorum]MBC9783737.1 glycosyltransferase family 61 protein [Heliobacterium chlorum]